MAGCGIFHLVPGKNGCKIRIPQWQKQTALLHFLPAVVAAIFHFSAHLRDAPEGLLQVCYDVCRVLQTHRNADHAIGNPALGAFLRA